MAKVPKNVRAHISNAKYYLEAARNIPDKLVGVRVFLLLTGWENARLAEEELHSWIYKTPKKERVEKSHELKLDDVRKPFSEMIRQPDGRMLEKAHLSAAELSKLLQTSRYGLGGGEIDLNKFFSPKEFTRWHTDEFERGLVSKINWAEAHVNAQEALPNT